MLFNNLNESLDKYFIDDTTVCEDAHSNVKEIRHDRASKTHIDESGKKTLIYNNLPICEIINESVKLLPGWNENKYSLRHLREFLQRNGFTYGSSREMKKLYESLEEDSDSYIIDFLKAHDNNEDYKKNQDIFLNVYNILFNHGDIDDSISELYIRCSNEEKDSIKELINKIK